MWLKYKKLIVSTFCLFCAWNFLVESSVLMILLYFAVMMMLVSWLSWCSWWFFFCGFQWRPIKGRLNPSGRKPGSRSTRTVNMNILLLSMATTVILSQMEGYTAILRHLSEYVSEFLGISGGSLIYLRPHHMLQWMLKFRLMLDAGGHWTVVFFYCAMPEGKLGTSVSCGVIQRTKSKGDYLQPL